VTIDDFKFNGCSFIKHNIAEVFYIIIFLLFVLERGGSSIPKQKPVPSHRMSHILTYVLVELVATTDVQSLLEIPATDEILVEDRNHGLA